jgi:AsmA protein
MKKAVKISAITVAAVMATLIFLVFTPMIFREKFAAIVKSTANKELKTEMNFSEMEVSFFHHFPNMTITLRDFSLRSSPPFLQDTLISARDISFGVNLKSLFSGPLRITRVYINKGKVAMQYNENGASSFEVYNASKKDTVETADTTPAAPVAFQIDNIYFIQTDFIYSDASIPLKVEVHGINYRGKSKFKDDILRLDSRVAIDSLDLWYDNVRYLKSKPVKANLTTSINMSSLNMKFEKNDLYIKDIPFEFKGEFNFRKDGYSLFLSLFSMFGKEYFSGSVYLVSTNTLWVSAKADVNIDLQTWTQAFGVRDYALSGLFSMKLNAQGEYATGPDSASRKPATVIRSIPDVTFSSKLTNGSLRIGQLPQAITGISFNLDAATRNHDYRSVTVRMENLKAAFMKNTIEGFFRVNGLRDLPLEGHLVTRVNLAEIRNVIPIDSLDLKGMLDINLDVNGNYAPEKKLFPEADLSLSLKNGFIRTKYFPVPLENINIAATVNNATGQLSGTKIILEPLSFTFEGNPFVVNAKLDNPDDLAYDITAHGSVDVSKIYHLFSQEGLDLDGFVSMNLVLKGRQSDAMAGRYDRLLNKGRLELRDIAFASEFLPLPFVVKEGVFRFDNDDIRFEKFSSVYGSSDITLDGHLTNVVNYVLADNQKLKGSFTFSSNYLLVDEFLAHIEESSASSPQSAVVDSTVPGVIVVPGNLEIGLNTDIKKIRFQNLDINSLTATVEVKQGMLLLKDMSFDLIGCKVAMDATYGSVNPNRAFFDFHVKADNFDIKRAYNEVALFRNISTSAGKCEGIVSLEYTLKGKLDEGMNPIYPSLEGNGVLTLEKVKVMGLKLFTSMSRNLEKEQIKDPDLSKVEIRTTIKKNVITLEKTRMKFAGFRFRISGETNFNGRMNLRTRLGLPPLGIVGIPMRILGTQENPKFKYGRGTKDEDVEETEYTDELSPEMLKLIHNAKTEDLQDEDKIR